MNNKISKKTTALGVLFVAADLANGVIQNLP
jgi:hypothetical protein